MLTIHLDYYIHIGYRCNRYVSTQYITHSFIPHFYGIIIFINLSDYIPYGIPHVCYL